MSTISETISVLEEYNKWRRGDETISQPDPFEVGVAIGDAVRLLRELAAERERVRVLRSHGVEALMVARSWQMVWGDKLSPESVAIFTKHEQAFLAALAATKEGA